MSVDLKNPNTMWSVTLYWLQVMTGWLWFCVNMCHLAKDRWKTIYLVEDGKGSGGSSILLPAEEKLIWKTHIYFVLLSSNTLKKIQDNDNCRRGCAVYRKYWIYKLNCLHGLELNITAQGVTIERCKCNLFIRGPISLMKSKMFSERNQWNAHMEFIYSVDEECLICLISGFPSSATEDVLTAHYAMHTVLINKPVGTYDWFDWEHVACISTIQ